jgi:CHAT domain-containing protein
MDLVPISYAPSVSLLRSADSASSSLEVGNALVVGIGSFPLWGLPELPQVYRETDAIISSMKLSGIPDTCVVSMTDRQGAVRLETVLGRLREVNVAHFATHAGAGTENAYDAWLYLSKERLTAEAVLGLDCGPAVVTLSACRTLVGHLSPSEGLQGLAHAFMLAGSEAVVATAWSVVDEVTSFYFAKFYERLNSGICLAESAQVAAQEVRAMRMPASLDARRSCGHPFFWSPFMLYSTIVPTVGMKEVIP